MNVSVQTVQNAYEQLLSEGYIYSVERSGCFISAYNDDRVQAPVQKKTAMEPEEERPVYNLKNGQMDERAFPYKIWQKIYKSKLRIWSHSIREHSSRHRNVVKSLAAAPLLNRCGDFKDRNGGSFL